MTTHNINTAYARTNRVMDGGKAVTLRDGETVPRHADMLRYDLGFCDPNDISIVVLPVFRSKSSRTPPRITVRRWASYGLAVEPLDENFVDPLSWTTYRHKGEDATAELVPVTLAEYLRSHPGDKVAGWR